MGLDTIELILEAEDHFGVSVPDEQAEQVVTVEQFAKLLWGLQPASRSLRPYDQVLSELQQIIADRFNIPLEHVIPTARFIKDLGLDQ